MRQIIDSRTKTFNIVVEQFIGNMVQSNEKLTSIVQHVKTAALDLNQTLMPVTTTMKNIQENTKRKILEETIVPPQFAHDWYYLDVNDEPVGPISFQELRKRYQEKIISDVSMLLYGQSSTWKMASVFPDLLDALGSKFEEML